MNITKKSVLALAILGAFAGSAAAQSSVTVYGRVDASIDRIDNGTAKTTGLDSGNNSASRIGFKGVEDLGGGLKALFVLENGLNVDDGSTSAGFAFSRLAYVGMSGSFGKVLLGRQNTQVKDMIKQIDPFGATGMVNGVDFVNGGGIPQRVPNQITFHSKSYGGFSGTLGYRLGETAGDSSANRGYGARVGYHGGPLNVQLAYNNQNTTDAGTDTDVKDTLLGATYAFSSFKLHGLLGQRTTDNNITNTSVTIRSGLVGVTVPFGVSKVRAEYIRNQNRDVADADSNVWAVSYTYDMSKRTELYATYLASSNEANSTLGYGGPGSVTAGERGSAVAVGILHKF